MVAVVSGSGLGLYSSQQQTRENVGSTNQGQNPEEVYVNSTTGNLVIQDQDEALSSLGVDLPLIRTYNSQGLMNDDNGDNWRLGVQERVFGLTGTANTAGSTITKEFGDGAQVVYTYNATLGAYVSALGDGAHDTLSFNSSNSQWTWTAGAARNTETYNSTGQLVSATDVNANTRSYAYTGSLLTSIADASGQTTYLDYTGNNLTQIRVVSSGQTQTVTHYAYDGQNRLQTVTVDLSPADNSVSDGNKYVTTYTYDGTSTRVASITQADGTTVSFAYIQEDGAYRLRTYTDGDGKVTTFTYSSGSATGASTSVTANANAGALSTTNTTSQTYNLIAAQLTAGTAATPTYTQGNSNAPQSPTNSVAVTYTSAQVVGDLNVIAIGWNDSTHTISSVTDSAGNTYTLAIGPTLSSGNAGQSIYYAKNIHAAAANSNTVTVTFSGSVPYPDVRIAEYSGVDTSSPLDVTHGAVGSSTSTSSGAVTTTNAKDLIVGANYVEHSTTGPGSSFTQRLMTVDQSIFEDRNVTATGSYTATAPQTPTGWWVMQLAAFKAGTTPSYYLVPASATWQSIANTLYGVNSAAAGTALQTAMGNPTLSTGLHLTGLPATLTVTTTTTVPAYYLVPAGATWTSITQAVYGTSNANAVAALQTATGNPTLTTGLHLTVPSTLTYTAPSTLYMHTDIADGTGQTSSVIADSSGRVTSLLSPVVNTAQLRTDFTYDSDNNILTIARDPTGLNRVTTMTYDTNGNLTLTRDADGDTVTRTYNSANQVVTQTTYQVADPDGSGSGQPSSPMTVRYAYDTSNRLRYTVTGDGRVTENRYNSVGELTSALKYDAAVYDVSSLSPTTTLSESTLTTWAASQDLTRVERVDYAYDFRGNLSSATQYASTDATGTGITTGDSVTNYVYDQRGELLQRIDPRGTTTSGTYVTTYLYDGLGRQTSTTQWLASGSTAATTTTYDAVNNRVTTTLANGTAMTSVYDHAGHLISVTTPNSATTNYAYDADGRLRMTTDPVGVKTYVIYDNAGRKVGDIDGNGELTKYFYDSASNVVETVHYADALTSTTLATLVDGSGNPTNISIDSLVAQLPTTVGRASDQILRNVYDIAGRLVYAIDAAGDLTQYDYDGAGRVVDQVQYYTTVTISSSVTSLTPAQAQALITINAARDRRTRYFYDNDGHLRGTLDARGYLTEYTYDAGGHLTRQMQYATQSNSSYWATGTLANLIPALDDETTVTPEEDATTYYFYDGEGRQIGEFQRALVNGTGYLTETQYDAAGNVSATVRYDKTLTYTVGTSTFASLKAAALPGAVPQTTSYLYDGANHVVQETNYEGTVTSYTYDSVGNLISQTVAVGATGVPNDTRTTQKRYDSLGHVTQELSAQGSAQIIGGMTQAQIDAIWLQYGTQYTYDADGRLVSATTRPSDPIAGNQTLTTYYYYDGDSQLRFTVNPAGEVAETRYNALGQVTDQFAYYTRLSSLTGISGGLLTPTVQSTLTAVANSALDEHVSSTYKLTGQEATSTTAEGAYETHGYNAFGEETTRTQKIDSSRTLTTTFDYDLDGDQITEAADSGGIGQSNTYTYDAFDRQSSVTDQYGNKTQTQYDRLGRTIVTYDALNNKASAGYDAFSRVLSTTDALNKTTNYVYTDSTRTVVVTTPEGVSVTTVHNRNGQALSVTSNGNTTTYGYDLNGNVTSISDGKGTIESRVYDSAGREVTSTDGLGSVTRFTYDAAGRVLSRVVDYGGQALTTSYTFDGLGFVEQVVAPGNKVTATAYDRDGRIKKVTVDPAALNLQTYYTYDNNGDVVTVTEGYGSTNPRVTQYTYDVLGRRTLEVVDPGTGTNPSTGRAYLNATTQYFYDANGDLTQKIDANNNSTWYIYDKDNRLHFSVDALGGVTETKYDADGRVSSTRRYATAVAPPASSVHRVAESGFTAPGTTTSDRFDRHYYDGDGREVYTIDSMGGVTERVYDAGGNVTRLRIFGNVTLTGTYNTTADVQAAIGTTNLNTIASTDRVTWTAYDVRGRAVYSVDASGAVTQNVFDAGDDIIQTTQFAALYTPSSGTSFSAVDGWAQGATILSNSQNRVTRFWYDKTGRQVYSLDAAGYLTKTQYDDANRRTFTTIYAQKPQIPAGVSTNDIATQQNGVVITTDALNDQATETDYDAAGRVVKVVDATGHYETYGYDAVGNKTSYTNQNQKTWTYVFDANHHLIEEDSPPVDVTEMSVSSGSLTPTLYSGATLVSLMTYDLMGNVKTKTEGLVRTGSTTVTTWSRLTQYGYDALGRQTSVTLPTVSVYNAAGDNLALTGSSVVATESSYTAVTQVTYDTLGNAIANRDAAGNYSYKVYDADGRVTYDIDAMNYVTGYTYDTFGNQRTETRYANPLSGTIPSSVTGLVANGLTITAAYSGTTANFSVTTDSTHDRTVTTTYNSLNQAISVAQTAVFSFEPTQDAPGGTPLASVSPTTTYQYNAFGQVILTSRLVDGPTATWAYTYDYYDNRGLKTAEVDADGYRTSYEYNDSTGDMTRSIEYAVKVSGSTTAAPGSPTLSNFSTNPSGSNDGWDRETTYTHDQLNRLLTQTQIGVVSDSMTGSAGSLSNSRSAPNVVTTYGYDALGNQTTVNVTTGTVSAGTTFTFYDVLGRVIAMTAPARDRGDGTSVTPLTLMKRDVYGNLVETIQYANGTNSTLTSGGAAPTAASPVAALDRDTRIRVDVEGHALQTEQEFAAGAGNTIDQFASYEAHGNLAKQWQIVTNPGDSTQAASTDALVTVYTYDALGRQTAVIKPQSPGVISNQGSHYNAFGEIDYKSLDGTVKEYFYYDQAGRMWLTNTGDGAYRVYLYNLAGQSTAKLEIPATSTINLAAIGSSSAAYNQAYVLGGLMTTETVYDLMGHVTEQRQPKFMSPSNIENMGGATANVTVTTASNGVTYLEWQNPADSTLQTTLIIDSGDQTANIVHVTTSGTEYGYTAGFSVAGMNGSHSYKITWTRPGDSVVFGEATGTFSVNTNTTTTLGITTATSGTISNVTSQLGGSGVQVGWTSDLGMTAATFEINIGGTWYAYAGSGTSESSAWTATFAFPANGTYQYRITDIVNGSTEAFATGTLSFTNAYSTSSTSTTGSGSADAAWSAPGVPAAGASIGAQVNGISIGSSSTPLQTPITNESGQITGYTTSWSGTNVVNFNNVSTGNSGTYTFFISYNSHADSSRGIASTAKTLSVTGYGGSAGQISWTDTATGSGSTWPAGGIDSINYIQILQNGVVVADSRSTGVTAATLTYPAPASGWGSYIQIRQSGTSTYTTVTPSLVGSNMVYTFSEPPPNSSWDIIVVDYVGTSESPTELTQTSGTWVIGASSSYVTNISATAAYGGSSSVSGNTLYWASSGSGYTVSATLNNTSSGAVMYSLTPQTSDGTNYSANFYNYPSGTYKYVIQYSSGGVVAKQISGTITITTTTTVTNYPAVAGPPSAPTNLGAIAGVTDLGNGVLQWTTPANSGDSVVFKYKAAGATSWAGTLSVSGPVAGPFQVTIPTSVSGSIDYEIDYTASGAAQPYRVGLGRVVITRTTSTTGSASDTTSTTLASQPAQPKVKQLVDRWGNAYQVTNAAGVTTYYLYNQFNQMYQQDTSGVNVASVSTSTGVITPSHSTIVFAYNYYDSYGRLVGTRDGDGNVNSQTYNNAGQVIAESHADGGTKNNVYDVFGDQIQVTTAISSGLAYKTRNAYDQGGRLTDVEQEVAAGNLTGAATGNAADLLPASNVTIVRTSYGYDQAGRRISTTDGAAEVTHYWYDLHGNLTRTSDPLAHVTQYGYDELDHQNYQKDADNNTMSWTYDYFGKLKSHTDMSGTIYTYNYDAGHSELLTSVTSAGGNYAGVSKTYTYDGANHLTELTDTGANSITAYGYDVYGRLAHQTQFDNGLMVADDRTDFDTLGRTAHISGLGYSVSYSYDAAGNRTEILAHYSDAANSNKYQDLWFEYDAMNRVVLDSGYSNGTSVSVTTTQGTSLTYDWAGERTSSYTMGTAWTYNLSTGAYTAGAGYQTLNYGYDGLGRLKTTTTPTIEYYNGAYYATIPTTVDARYYDQASRMTEDDTTAVSGTSLSTTQQVNAYNADGTLYTQSNKKNGYQQSMVYYVGGYDAVGNLMNYSFNAYNATGTYQYTGSDTFYYSRNGDSYLQTDHYVSNSGTNAPANGHTTNTYNVDQQLTQYTDTVDATKNRYFDDNAQGEAVVAVQGNYGANPSSAFTSALMSGSGFFNSTNAGYFFFTPDGKSVGTFGQLSGSLTANFDVNFTPISSTYPATTPPKYVVQAGDTLSIIAARVYGDAKLWYVIAQANGLTDPTVVLPEDMQLTIPSNVVPLSNNSTTFKPFDVRLAIGDQTPTQPLPPPPKHSGGGCGLLGTILIVVVAVIVTIYTAGAASEAFAGTLGSSTVGGTFATGATVLTGGTVAGVSTAGVVASAAIGGAVGSIASQGVAIATGQQNGFSWSGVAIGAIGAAVGAGLGQVAQGSAAISAFAKADPYAFAAVNGAVGNAITQGVSVATGLQSSFNWQDVAISAVSAPLAKYASSQVPNISSSAAVNDFARGAVAGVTSTAVRVALGGKVDIATALADAFGNALANSYVKAESSPGAVGTANTAVVSATTGGSSGTGAGVQQEAAPQDLAPQADTGNNNPVESGATTPAPAVGADGQSLAEVLVTANRIPPGVDVGLDLFALMMEHMPKNASQQQRSAVDTLGDIASLNYSLRRQGVQPTEYLRQAIADQVRNATGNDDAYNTALKYLNREANGPTFGEVAKAVGLGVLDTVEALTVEPALQVRDMALAGTAVAYNSLWRKDGQEYWLPSMSSNVAKAYDAGTSQSDLLFRSNPLTGLPSAIIDTGLAFANGDTLGGIRMTSGLLTGVAAGEVIGRYGTYNLRSPIVGVGPGSMGMFGIEDVQSPFVAPEVGPDGRAYSVAFSTQLDNDSVARSDSVHFNRANAALDAVMQADPEFKAMMEQLIPGVGDAVSKVGGRETPDGWTWHHGQDYGTMELTPTDQHTSPAFQDTYHPGGTGGYADWAVPAGAPARHK